MSDDWFGQGKRREGPRVSIRVSVVIRHKYWSEISVLWMAPVDGALAADTNYAIAQLMAEDSQILVHR